jgi:hypothetical protein
MRIARARLPVRSVPPGKADGGGHSPQVGVFGAKFSQANAG